MANPHKGSISSRLSKLEKGKIKVERWTPAKKKLLKSQAVLLIGKLGWGAMAKEVEQGKHSAAETLQHLSTQKMGMTPEKRRIAKLGAKAAAGAGI
jgi:hypothetical protein